MLNDDGVSCAFSAFCACDVCTIAHHRICAYACVYVLHLVHRWPTVDAFCLYGVSSIDVVPCSNLLEKLAFDIDFHARNLYQWEIDERRHLLVGLFLFTHPMLVIVFTMELTKYIGAGRWLIGVCNFDIYF